MRTKAEILTDLGITKDYNPHAGLRGEIKDVILAELLIDIRDELHLLTTFLLTFEPYRKHKR